MPKLLYDNLPYLLLSLLILGVLFQTVAEFPIGVSDDLIGQLGHWLTGGATAVTLGETSSNTVEAPEPGASFTTAVVFSVRADWWSREAHLRERDAAQLLSVLTEARGKNGVVIEGISLEGFQDEETLALLLHHPDPQVLRNTNAALRALPAAEWIEPRFVFFGVQSSGAEASLAQTGNQGNKSPSEETTAMDIVALILERKNTDWFLLSPDKQKQLLSPRKEALVSLPDIEAVTLHGLGFSPFSQLTVVRGTSVTAVSNASDKLRGNWEQKYVDDAVVLVGLARSVSELFDGLR